MEWETSDNVASLVSEPLCDICAVPLSVGLDDGKEVVLDSLYTDGVFRFVKLSETVTEGDAVGDPDGVDESIELDAEGEADELCDGENVGVRLCVIVPDRLVMGLTDSPDTDRDVLEETLSEASSEAVGSDLLRLRRDAEALSKAVGETEVEKLGD